MIKRFLLIENKNKANLGSAQAAMSAFDADVLSVSNHCQNGDDRTVASAEPRLVFRN